MNSTVYSPRTAKAAVAKPATVSPLRALVQRIDSARSLAAMLLTVMIATLVVLGDQLINTWADEHLLVAWVALWTVAFAAMALLAPAAARVARGLLASLAERRELARRQRSDERLWALARSDSRVMSDLQAAISRSQD